MYGRSGLATLQLVAEDGTRTAGGSNRSAHDYTVNFLKQAIDLVRHTYNLPEIQ